MTGIRLRTGTLLLSTLLAGCVLGDWVARTLYNGLDNRLWNDVADFANFRPEQENWIRASIASFHDWHRSRELPRYRQLMDELMAVLAEGNPDAAQIRRWSDQLEGVTARMNHCNPLRQSVPLLASLDDEQARQFGDKLDSMLEESRQEVLDGDPAQREKERYKAYRRYFSRAGLKLDDAQQAALQATLAERFPTREPGLELWAAWNETFISLLEQRDQPGFALAMQQHLDGLGTLSERHRPAERAHNKALWEAHFAQLFASQDSQQRQRFVQTLKRYAQLLAQLENDALHGPEAAAEYQPAPGCEPAYST